MKSTAYGSVGNSIIPDKKADKKTGGALTKLDLSDVASIPKVGDRLLTGQIVQ